MSPSDDAFKVWHEVSSSRRRIGKMLGNWPEHEKTLLEVLHHLNEASKLIYPFWKDKEPT